MDAPLVSIIIPSYNVESYLSDACESVLAQTYSNWEAIIVDDGSKDNTAQIADFYCKADERFHYIYQENKGLSGARKTGIDTAKGLYVQFLDADDALLPERLEQMVEASEAVDDQIILYSDFWVGINNSLKDTLISSSRPFNPGHDITWLDMYTGWRTKFLFVPACTFFRRSIFSEIAYDESLRSVEDWDLYLSMLSCGYLFRGIDHKNILYRDNPNGLSRNKSYIYTQLFVVLNKWKNDERVHSGIYEATIAKLYAEILVQHFWKKRTDIIEPLQKGLLIRFYTYTIINLLLQLVSIFKTGIIKKVYGK